MWTRPAFTASGRNQGCVCACVCNKLNRFFKDDLKSQKEFKVTGSEVGEFSIPKRKKRMEWKKKKIFVDEL